MLHVTRITKDVEVKTITVNRPKQGVSKQKNYGPHAVVSRHTQKLLALITKCFQ